MENVTFIFAVSVLDFWGLVAGSSILVQHFENSWGYTLSESKELTNYYLNEYEIFKCGSCA